MSEASDHSASRIDWAAFNLVGQSLAFRNMLELIQRWASVDATVLLHGETGTGKELAARAIHALSARRDEAFVAVNCGAITDSLFESELFGHVKGAFTDAKHDRLGLIAQAEGGTLFLDEINSLSPRGQVALLRFAQDRSYRAVGGRHVKSSDVRLIAASNADLDRMADSGQFRGDLLFRLNLLRLNLPPLRERERDALLLARTFVQRFAQQYGLAPKVLDEASVRALERMQPWPGNVRELEHLVHRSVLLCRGATVDLGLTAQEEGVPEDVDGDGGHAPETASFAKAKARAIADFEQRYVRDLLLRTQGNISLAARLAGKERSRFSKLVRKHGLQRNAFGA